MLLFYDIVLSKSVSLSPTYFLADQYCFIIQDQYLDHWTYTLSARGRQVISYYYSTYEQPSSMGVNLKLIFGQPQLGITFSSEIAIKKFSF